jgi:glycosyltransferase involved in cell wall biosynthesis
VVVIGRNEGERLPRCLASVAGFPTVYVDSGSTDGSVAQARALGAHVVELEGSRPFSAARARNEGFRAALGLNPGVRHVQFVDGDCEVREGWLGLASAALDGDRSIAAVCGRLRERHPERSVYNRMCDLSWEAPAGEVESCGGLAMYDAAAFAAVGGFREGMVVGEEFELCARLRARGGRVVRLDNEMAWHDVNITRFSQWWRRASRVGFAAAEGSHVFDHRSGRTHRTRAARALVWGGVVPLTVLILAVLGFFFRVLWVAAAAALLLWLANVGRLASRNIARHGVAFGLVLAWFSMVSKVSEFVGMVRYVGRRSMGRPDTFLAYRGQRASR